MKKAKYSWALVLLAVILTACGKRETKEDTWTAPDTETVIRQLPDLRLTDSVRSGAHVYVYNIERVASDSLPTVRDDMDDLYRDNVIRLVLSRDGQCYFDRKFTKDTFAASLDKKFYKGAILDGIRFLRAEPGAGLLFSFAVSFPDSDMSVPFLMTITDAGAFSFVKDENLDREDDDPVFFDNDGV